MEKITISNHQELFDAFRSAALLAIYDYSSYTSEDELELQRWAEEYATAQGLELRSEQKI